MSHSFEHIILSRPDRIGDVVVSTACIASVKERFPDARIVMLVDERLVPLLEGHPLLDGVVGLPLFDQKKAYEILEKAFPDTKRTLLVELNPNPWVRRFARTCRGLAVRRYRSSFFDLFGYVKDRRGQGRIHEALASWDLMKGLGIPVPPALRASLPVYEDAWEPLCRCHSALIRGHFAVFHLGAHGGKRSWPVAKFVQVAAMLAEARGWRPVLVGVDSVLNREFISLYAGALSPLDLSNNTSLRELGALLSHAELVISRDSGPAHLGAAVGCPTVALMSSHPKHCANRWAPLGECVAVIEQPLVRKRPWESRDVWWERVYASISVDEVMRAVERVVPF